MVIFSMHGTISGNVEHGTIQILITYPGHNQIYFFIYKGHNRRDRYNKKQ